MKNLRILLVALFVCLGYFSTAQMIKEQIVDISKKAARGAPSQVTADDTKKEITIIYTTKAQNRLIKFDVVQLDYELNVINEYSDELEIEKARAQYQWFGRSYRGDEYTVTGLQLGGITANKLELVETKYTYGWFSGKYKSKEKVIKEVKAKDLFGKAMYNPHMLHWTDPQSGDLIYINAVMNKKSFGYDNFVITRVNTSLEKTVVQEFEVGYWQRVLAYGTIDNGDGDWYAIFADTGGKGVYKPKNNVSPTPTRWTYFKFGANGEIKDQITFKTKLLNWDVSGATQRDGAVYIYGSGETKGIGERHQQLLAALGDGKQDAFQVVMIAEGEAKFISAPSLDQINAASIKPPNQKKTIAYNGKKVEVRGINITTNGDLFINAQDFSGGYVKGAGGYQDLYMLHFSADGTFRRFYGIKSSQDTGGAAGLADEATNPRQYPTNGNIFEGSNGKLHWMMEVVEDVAKYSINDGTYVTTYWIPRRNLRVGQIDIASGQMDSFEVLGDGKFYLYNEIEPLTIDGKKQTVYLGTGGERGRQLWLAKFDPTKK